MEDRAAGRGDEPVDGPTRFAPCVGHLNQTYFRPIWPLGQLGRYLARSFGSDFRFRRGHRQNLCPHGETIQRVSAITRHPGIGVRSGVGNSGIPTICVDNVSVEYQFAVLGR